MPGVTARGIHYPLISEDPSIHEDMQTMAGDVNNLLAIGSTTTVTADGSGNATITHGLGRTPIAIVCSVVQSTSFLATPLTGATSTTFRVTVFNRSTGAAVPGANLPIAWVVY